MRRYFGLWGLKGRQADQYRRVGRARGETRSRPVIFGVRLPRAPLRNRAKLIRCRWRLDSIPRERGSSRSAGFCRALQMHFRSGKCRASTIFRRILALVGRPSMVRQAFSLINCRELTRLCLPRGPHRFSLAPSIVSIMCVMCGRGFGDIAFDSTRERIA